jgi:hypothetical protein
LRRLNPPKADERRLAAAFEHWGAALDDGSRLADAAECKDARDVTEAFRDAAREARAIARLIPDYPAGYCLGEGIGYEVCPRFTARANTAARMRNQVPMTKRPTVSHRGPVRRVVLAAPTLTPKRG